MKCVTIQHVVHTWQQLLILVPTFAEQYRALYVSTDQAVSQCTLIIHTRKSVSK